MSDSLLNIAVLFGGRSSEYSVSLQSAHGVICNLDRAKYNILPIGIDEEGRWFYYEGELDRIPSDAWKGDACTPLVLIPGSAGGICKKEADGSTSPLPIDLALPILHGKNGEDGTVQGLLQLLDIPLVGCGVLSSALCMDKDRAHRLAAHAGILVPRAVTVTAGEDRQPLYNLAKEVGYPLYVKPVKQGSSYGITRVASPEALETAIDFAFQYDDEVILEENIVGFEVGCAVLGGGGNLLVGEVDEIEIPGGFFDFTEKYNLITSAIYVPARISSALSEQVKETAKALYRLMGCRGFARVDMFITPDERIYFNEINTIPGFTSHSRYPGMMRAAGVDFASLLDKLIDYTLQK